MILPQKTTTRTLQQDTGKLTLYLAWGQSFIQAPKHPADASPNDQYWHAAGANLGDCKVWDKAGRNNWNTSALTDGDRSNEPHEFKPIVAGAAQNEYYWWETPPAQLNRTWWLYFSQLIREQTGRNIRLVSFGPGGSTLGDRGNGDPYWSHSNIGATDGTSYLRRLMKAYYAPALQAMIDDVGRDRIDFGGIITMVGTSESAATLGAANWKAEYLAIIDYMRGVINPSAPDQVPALIAMSPPSSTIQDIDVVRAQQIAAAAERVNVDVRDTSHVETGPDGLHKSMRGNDQLGGTFARWALGVTPINAPRGEDA